MDNTNQDLPQQPPDPVVDPTSETPDPASSVRPSRKAAWLAMGAVALALGLIWVAPGVNDSHQRQTAAAPGSPEAAIENEGDADDAVAEGKPAPLQFTLKDMNGVDVKLANFK